MSYFIDTAQTTVTENDAFSEFFEKLRFDVVSCDCFATAKPTEHATYMLQDYELVFQDAGSFRISCDGQTYLAGPGCLMLLEPYRLFEVEAVPNNICQYYFIHFRAEPRHLLEHFLRTAAQGDSIIHTDRIAADAQELMMQAFRETMGARLGAKCIVQSIVLYLLIRLMRCTRIGTSGAAGILCGDAGAEQLVGRATAYISQNLDRPLRVRDVAKRLSVSENYLYKTFMRVIGQSPVEYIRRIKIHWASELLRSGKYTVGEIAELLQFSSPNHFSNSFREIMGVSPSAFIRLGAQPPL